ncbi:M949_RS01915 family surface polysaccharide biosynthesis protein [Pseudoduganella sp. R-31]|uniref:M949_RS01915 family surface polysaccharide biosynthesis protein n=1 Tax=Pseudoduganella sp. R-31 TaxID=3404060 RepID=UPI003CF9A17F
MNNLLGLLMAACCTSEIPAMLKEDLKPNEQVVSLVRYSDSHGDHTLLLTERETAAKSRAGKAINLAAMSFNKNGAREWIIRDGAECPAGSGAKPTFFPNAAPVTDLNNDGTAEVTVAYSLTCGTESEPSEIKAIMRQGDDKYAMRGQALVFTSAQPVSGGTPKPDAALLLPENAAFLDHLRNIWNETSGSVARENAPRAPLQELEGEYSLHSSPDKWGYSKAHISIKRLDDRHVKILLACEWKHTPKAACDDYFFAKWHNDGVYLQDRNTTVRRIYFSPAPREIALAMVSVDGKRLYKLDSFRPASGPPSDGTLSRRLKRAQQISVSPENLRVFGPYNEWKYENNRLEFVKTTP